MKIQLLKISTCFLLLLFHCCQVWTEAYSIQTVTLEVDKRLCDSSEVFILGIDNCFNFTQQRHFKRQHQQEQGYSGGWSGTKEIQNGRNQAREWIGHFSSSDYYFTNIEQKPHLVCVKFDWDVWLMDANKFVFSNPIIQTENIVLNNVRSSECRQGEVFSKLLVRCLKLQSGVSSSIIEVGFTRIVFDIDSVYGKSHKIFAPMNTYL